MNNNRRESLIEILFLNNNSNNNRNSSNSSNSSNNNKDNDNDNDNISTTSTSSSDSGSVNVKNLINVSHNTKRSLLRRTAVLPAPKKKKTLYFCSNCKKSIYQNDTCYLCCNCTSIHCKSCNDDNKCSICLRKLTLLDKNNNLSNLIPNKSSRCFCFF